MTIAGQKVQVELSGPRRGREGKRGFFCHALEEEESSNHVRSGGGGRARACGLHYRRMAKDIKHTEKEIWGPIPLIITPKGSKTKPATQSSPRR